MILKDSIVSVETKGTRVHNDSGESTEGLFSNTLVHSVFLIEHQEMNFS